MPYVTESVWAETLRVAEMASARIEKLEAQNRALRRKLAEHGVTLIDNVDDHLAALTSTSKALSTGG